MVVLAYLSDPLNGSLRSTLQKSMKPGSRIVSHSFLMSDWKRPIATYTYGRSRRSDDRRRGE
jgi:hypothetical protein